MSFFRRNRDEEDEEDEQESTSSGSSRPFSGSRLDDQAARPAGRTSPSQESEGDSPFRRSTIFSRTSGSDDEDGNKDDDGGRRTSPGSGFSRPSTSSPSSSGGGSPFRRGGDDNNDTSTSSGSPFRRAGDSSGSSGSSGFSRPGGSSPAGGSGGSSSFQRSGDSSSSSSSSSSPFRRGGDNDNANSSSGGGSPFRRGGDSPASSSGSDSSRPAGGNSPFRRGGDSNDSDTDKSSGSGSSGGGSFFRRGGDSSPSSSGGSNRSGSNRPASSAPSSSGGGSPFRRGGDSSPSEGDKSASSGSSGGGGFFRRGGDSSPSSSGGSNRSGSNRPASSAPSSSSGGSPFRRGGDSSPSEGDKSGSSGSSGGGFFRRGGDSSPSSSGGSNRSGSNRPASSAPSSSGGGSPFRRGGDSSPSSSGGSNRSGSNRPASSASTTSSTTSSGGGGLFRRGSDSSPSSSSGKPDDKSSGGGGFFRRGGGGDDKSAAGNSSSRTSQASNDKPSGGGGLFRRGGGGDDKPATPAGRTSAPANDKPSGGGGLFRRGGGDDKPATPAGRTSAPANDKPSGGGGLFRRGGDDKPATPSGRTSASSRTQSPARGGSTRAKSGQSSRSSGGKSTRGSAKPLPSTQSKRVNVRNTGLTLDQKLDLLGIGLLALAIVLASGLFTSPDSTSITETVDSYLAQLFGVGRVVLPLTALIAGLWLLKARFGDAIDIEYLRVAGILMLFVALLTSLQWYFLLFGDLPQTQPITDPTQQWVATKASSFVEYTVYPTWTDLETASQVKWEAGEAGGLVGHTLYIFLARQLGDYGVVAFMGIIWIIALMFAAQTSTGDIAETIRSIRHSRQVRQEAKAAKREMRAAEKAGTVPAAALAIAGATAAGASASTTTDETKQEEESKPVQRALPTGRPSVTETGIIDPAKELETAEQRAPRRGLFGRRSTPTEDKAAVAGSEETPTRAPSEEKTETENAESSGGRTLFGRRLVGGKVEADTAAEEPKGRRAAGETEETEGTASGGRRLGGLFGRRSSDAESTESAETPATAATTGDETTKTESSGSRFSLGLPGRRKSAESQEEEETAGRRAPTSETKGSEEASTDEGARRGGLLSRLPGRRSTEATDKESSETSQEASDEATSETAGRRRLPSFGRKTEDATAIAASEGEEKTISSAGRFGRLPFGRKPADATSEETPASDTASTAPTSEDKADTESSGGRFGRLPFGRRSAPETPSDAEATVESPASTSTETPASTEQAASETSGDDLKVAASLRTTPDASTSVTGRRFPTGEAQTEDKTASTGQRSFSGFRRQSSEEDTQASEATSPFGRRATGEASETSAAQPGRRFGRFPREDSTEEAATETSAEATKPTEATSQIPAETSGESSAIPAEASTETEQPTSRFGALQSSRPTFGRRPETEDDSESPFAQTGSTQPAKEAPAEATDTSETPETVETLDDQPAQATGRFGALQSSRPSFGRRPETEDDTEQAKPASESPFARTRSAMPAEETPTEATDSPETLDSQPAQATGRFGALQSSRPSFGRRPETEDDTDQAKPASESPFARTRSAMPAEEATPDTADTSETAETVETLDDQPAQATGRFGALQSSRPSFGRRPETEDDTEQAKTASESPFARTHTSQPTDTPTEEAVEPPVTEPKAQEMRETPATPVATSETAETPTTPRESARPATPTPSATPASSEAAKPAAGLVAGAVAGAAAGALARGAGKDKDRANLDEIFGKSADETPEDEATADQERLKEVIRNRGRLDEDGVVEEAAGTSGQAGTSSPTTAPAARAAAQPAAPAKVDWKLPAFMELLEPGSEQDIDQYFLLEQARIIEDTLSSFGAPGKVVEVNSGPVITQFGVEPDYIERRGGRTRVKVSAIAALDKDIALALAARSIRIEAPVPGKGFVGIEVPNAEASLVSLRDVMSSDEHQRTSKKSSLMIGLGQSVDGSPISADLTAMPHLLIAGTTGSGKSVCVNAIISCLLLQNSPDDLQLIMVDPKRVELTGYNGIPHLISNVVVDLERIIGVLKWVQREMDERYRKLNEKVCRNIQEYNRRAERDGFQKLPFLVVIIDELADLMMLAPDETEKLIARLAQMARATGIHLIISTQRPSVDVVTGLIKANFPARIAFAVASGVDSRVILDQPGADRLLGRGDMLYQAPDASSPLRMQGVYLSDPEIDRITRYWKEQAVVVKRGGTFSAMPKPHDPTEPELQMPTARSERYDPSPSTPAAPATPSASQKSFWAEVDQLAAESKSSSSGDGDDEDDLYSEAVDVVTSLNKASVSLLQRRLRIGYTRAARLIDMMEERGIIGPAESGSKPRSVLIDGESSDDDE